jgi:hypothetical protein
MRIPASTSGCSASASAGRTAPNAAEDYFTCGICAAMKAESKLSGSLSCDVALIAKLLSVVRVGGKARPCVWLASYVARTGAMRAACRPPSLLDRKPARNQGSMVAASGLMR